MVFVFLTMWFRDLFASAGTSQTFISETVDDGFIHAHSSQLPKSAKTNDIIVVKKVGSFKKVRGPARLRNKYEGRIGLSELQLDRLSMDEGQEYDIKISRNKNLFNFIATQWKHPDSSIRTGFKITVWITLATTVLALLIEEFYYRREGVVAAEVEEVIPDESAVVQTEPSPVNAKFLDDKPYDGDSFWVQADVWPGMIVEQKVRVRGINTPEQDDTCAAETYNAGKEEIAKLISEGVILERMEDGLYPNRVVADVKIPGGDDLAEALLEKGLAKPYEGGEREPWC